MDEGIECTCGNVNFWFFKDPEDGGVKVRCQKCYSEYKFRYTIYKRVFNKENGNTYDSWKKGIEEKIK